jgi:oligoendopeptidase F
MHPLAGDLTTLKDAELESKISDLTKKYFMTRNPGVQAQMVAMLDSYNEELRKRQQEALAKMMANKDKTLDKLIKVN